MAAILRLLCQAAAFLLQVLYLVQAKQEDCNKAYKQLFYRGSQAEDILIPQLTLIKLIWLQNNCFEKDLGKQTDLSRYIGLSDISEEDCDSDRLDLRSWDESDTRPNTNLRHYAMDYNRLQCEFCRPLLSNRMYEIAQLLNDQDREFSARIFATVKQVDAVSSLGKDNIRLKAAFLLLQEYVTDLNDFMKNKSIAFFKKRKRLHKDFTDVIVARCMPMMQTFQKTAQDLLKTQQNFQESELSSNFWLEVYQFCSDSIEQSDFWQVFEHWINLSNQPPEKAQDINAIGPPSQAQVILMESGSAEENALNMSRDPENSRVMAEYKLLLENEPNPTDLTPVQTLEIITRFKFYFERHRVTNAVEMMTALRGLSVVKVSDCSPEILRNRHNLHLSIANRNLRMYSEFYNDIQKQLCLEVHQRELYTKSEADKERREFEQKLETLTYAANQRREGKGEYRLRAALAYLKRYSELSRSSPGATVNRVHLFNVFKMKVSRPCSSLLAELKPDLRVLNVLLELAPPEDRLNLLNKDTKYIMMGAQVCRFLTQQVNEKMLFKAKGVVNVDKLEEEPEVAQRMRDLLDLDLFYDPQLNSPNM